MLHGWAGPFIKGVEAYLLLCSISTLAGRGIVRALRLKIDDNAEPALAAVLIYMLGSVVIGLTASTGIALRLAVPWIWGASGFLAVIGLLPPWPRPRTFLPSLLLCLALPVASLPHAFRVGLTEHAGTLCFDGFFYAAGGNYAWEHGLSDYRNYPIVGPSSWMNLAVWQHGVSSQEDLNVVHQLGATWPGHRWIGQSMLAFLSPLVHPGDTIADSSLLQAWSLYCLASAVLLYWLTQQQSRVFAFAATVFGVAAGWPVSPYWGNQLDNALTTPYLAVLAALVPLWGPSCKRKWLLIGATLAGLWYAYPPVAPFVMCATALVSMPHIWAERYAWRDWLSGSAVALLFGAILWLPAGYPSIPYMLINYAGAWDTSSILPGVHKLECYPSAFWGLGGETSANKHSIFSNLLGAAFSALAVLGIIRSVRTRQWGICLCVFMISGICFYTLLRLHFSYPFLKLFSVTWWCFAALMVSGATWLAGMVRTLHYRSALIAAMLVVGCEAQFVTALRHRQPIWLTRYPDLTVSAARHLGSFCKGLEKGSVLLAVEDWQPNLAALFYLRDKDLYLAKREGYMMDPRVTEFQARFPQPRLDRVRYIVCNQSSSWSRSLAQCAQLRWQGNPYELWQLDEAPREPMALQALPGIAYQWTGSDICFALGKNATALYLFSPEAGPIEVRLVCCPNRQLVDPGKCRISIATNGGYRNVVCLEQGPARFSVPVAAGINRLDLAVLDACRSNTTPSDALLNLVYLSHMQFLTKAATTCAPAGSDSQRVNTAAWDSVRNTCTAQVADTKTCPSK